MYSTFIADWCVRPYTLRGVVLRTSRRSLLVSSHATSQNLHSFVWILVFITFKIHVDEPLWTIIIGIFLRKFNNVVALSEILTTSALSGNWAEVSMRLSSRQCAPAACYSEFRKQVLRGHDVFRFHGGASSKNLFCVAPPTVQTRKVFEKSAELVLILSYYYYLFRIRIAILHM